MKSGTTMGRVSFHRRRQIVHASTSFGTTRRHCTRYVSCRVHEHDPALRSEGFSVPQPSLVFEDFHASAKEIGVVASAGRRDSEIGIARGSDDHGIDTPFGAGTEGRRVRPINIMRNQRVNIDHNSSQTSRFLSRSAFFTPASRLVPLSIRRWTARFS